MGLGSVMTVLQSAKDGTDSWGKRTMEVRLAGCENLGCAFVRIEADLQEDEIAAGPLNRR
jgi:hypothetical protein